MSDNYTVLNSTGAVVTKASKDLGSSVQADKAVPPDGWSVTHAPAINTAAVATKAAGATGVKHVCTGILCTLANDATGTVQLGILFNLRDGATGAGAILASITLSVVATAGACTTFAATGLNLPGTAATAMTLESASTPAAHTAASVTLLGYDSV